MTPPNAALNALRGKSNSLRLTLLGAATAPPVGAFVAYSSSADTFRQLWAQPLIGILATAAIGAAVCFVISAVLEGPLLALRRRLRWRWWSVTIAAALLSAAVLVAMAFLLILPFGPPADGGQRMNVFADMAGFLGFTVLIASAADGFFRACKSTMAMHAALSRARALEMQINPHFFFNTLNTIAAQIPEAPGLAQENVRLLAALFRRTMEHRGSTISSLAEEIDFVRHYLSIEQSRFGPRLNFELPTPVQSEGLEIPRLTLQPIVENAVHYGIGSLIEGGLVRLDVGERGTSYYITVTNPFDGKPPAPEQFFKEGHALQLVRQRLQTLYGIRADLLVKTSPGEVQVTIEVPTRTWKGAAACAS